jgi:beta-phosphoglucomutase-like phosphatase (HAD superfamily)
VEEERLVVTRHLQEVLRPDPSVSGPVAALSRRYRLAAVTSSASSRLDACLEATDLSQWFDPTARFSAETSLPTPTSKPDPAVYLLAGQRLGIEPHQGLAVEDSLTGARSAVAAGFATLGTVQFVPADEREERTRSLREVGVLAVLPDWQAVEQALSAGTP